MVVRWQFEDTVNSTTHTFAINPREEQTAPYRKSMTTVNTSAPDGRTLIVEGRDEPRRGSFSGVIRTESEFNTFFTWWDKRYQIKITDDLGREMFVIFESFEPVRVRSLQAPWKHTYTMSYVVVDW